MESDFVCLQFFSRKKLRLDGPVPVRSTRLLHFESIRSHTVAAQVSNFFEKKIET